MSPAVKRVLDLLRNYYASRDGSPHVLNDAQWAVYVEGLAPFSGEQLTRAAKRHMHQSEWFPKLSELLAILKPKPEKGIAAHEAWATVERAIRQAGRYRGATFLEGAIGETARQVFGTWPHACSYDFDSPGWAIRRQSFLALYPTLLGKVTEPVTLVGEFRSDRPLLVESSSPMPQLRFPTPVPEGPLSREEAAALVGTVRRKAMP